MITALLLSVAVVLPATGQAPRPLSPANMPGYVGQVPMLPLADGDHPDIDTLVGKYWRAYWRGAGELGFGMQQLRAGRFDLDGDGALELFLMIDSPAWQSDDGKPLVIAAWTRKGWMPVGWSWADEDRVFVIPERIDGWNSIDTGKHTLRWSAKGYNPEPKPEN